MNEPSNIEPSKMTLDDIASALEAKVLELNTISTNLSKLEKNIIDMARLELRGVLAYYQKRSEGLACAEDEIDYQSSFGAMNILLMFGHLLDSGMSKEGAQALREIEAQHAAAFRQFEFKDDQGA